VRNVSRVMQNHEESPLFVAPWTTSDFLDGKVHRLLIEVMAEDGSLLHAKIVDFCLSNECIEERASYDLAYFLLQPNIIAVIQLIFFASNFLLILISFLIQFESFKIFKIVRSPANFPYQRAIFRTFLWGPLWVVFGPWAVGYLLDETSLCLLFSWGVVTHSQVVPADITKAYAILFVIPYFYAIIFVVLFSLVCQTPRLLVAFHHIAFTTVMIFQFAHLPFIFKTFGFLASLGVWGVLRIVFVLKVWHLTHLAVSRHENGG
jgi:hypothetical protein